MPDIFLRNPTVERLPVVLDMLRVGHLVLPPFQRDFVWTLEQRLHLLDSVRRGLPFGSFLLWRTVRRLPASRWVGPYGITHVDAPPGGLWTYLLDGLQRFTTLVAALGDGLWTGDGRVPPRAADAPLPKDGEPWEIVYNLRERVFVAKGDESDEDETDDAASVHLPLEVLFDDVSFDEWRQRVALADRNLVREARQLQGQFRDYAVPLIPLYSEDLSLVQVAFKRVNEGGAPMDEVSLARALTWTESFDLRERLDALRGGLSPAPWREIDHTWILKVLAGLSGELPWAVDLEKVALAVRDGEAVGLLERAKRAIQAAIDALGELGVGGPRLLPYPYGLVFAAIALDRWPAAKPASVLHWLMRESYLERLGNKPPHVLRAVQRALEDRLEAEAQGRTAAGRRSRRGTAPRVRQDKKGFNLSWARSRLAALALASCGPRRPDGTLLHVRAHIEALGTAGLPVLFDRANTALPKALRAALDLHAGRGEGLGAGIENRVILPPTDVPALLEQLFGDAAPSDALLDSHALPREETRKLRDGSLAPVLFFRARAKLIRGIELERLRAWGLTSGDLVLPPEPYSAS